MIAVKKTKIILMVLMSVSFLLTSCQKTKEPIGKEEVDALEEENYLGTSSTTYGEEFYEKIPLLVNRVEGNYIKTTSPDGQIIISEITELETKNSFGGVTNFEKHNLTVGKNTISKYMKVYKDSLNRRIILQEGEEPQGDTLLKKAINFKPTVTYYSFYYYGETYYQSSLSSNPLGPDSGQYRVLRGGSWGSNYNVVRSAFRVWDGPAYPVWDGPAYPGYFLGFRCSRSP